MVVVFDLMKLRFILRCALYGNLLTGALMLLAEIKETHAIIKEWVSTEQLISEEEKDWAMEKSVLLDLQQALGAEINELNTKLQETEEEAVGAAKQREDLTARKMRHFRQPDPCTKDSTGQWQNWSGPLPLLPLLWQTILLPIAKTTPRKRGFPCYLYANGWTHLYHCFRQCKTSTVPSHWKDRNSPWTIINRANSRLCISGWGQPILLMSQAQ